MCWEISATRATAGRTAIGASRDELLGLSYRAGRRAGLLVDMIMIHCRARTIFRDTGVPPGDI